MTSKELAKKLTAKYKTFSRTGKLDSYGLCLVIHYIEKENDFRKVMSPPDEYMNKLRLSGMSQVFWGSGLRVSDPERSVKFTPVRQNLLLLYINYLNGKE